MSCPPSAHPAGAHDPWMDLGKTLLPIGTWTGVNSLAGLVAVWSRGEVNQCVTLGFTRVEHSACGLCRLLGEKGEKKISWFITVLWSLAGSNGFAVLLRLRETFPFC